MRAQRYIVFLGCIASLLLALGCSVADESETRLEASAQAPRGHDGTQGHDGQGDALSGKADAADSAQAAANVSCSQHSDCPAQPHTANWCSPEGTCRYSCERGFGDANQDTLEDGCECELSNGGSEMCNGVDDDCDGVIDNPFVGGQIAAGRRHTCAVDAAGKVHCWGEQEIETAEREGAAAFWEVQTGARHSCALTKQGDAFCWGDNRYGQVGPDAGRHADEPVLVSEELRFIDVATGHDHSCGLTYQSEVYCWGRNDYGQLGDGTLDERFEPVLVASDTHDFVDVTAGSFHTCAAKATGEVLCWGANLVGQAGQEPLEDVLEPAVVEVPEALIFVEAGANHTCGLTGEGRAFCWGNNSYGQLGDETRLSGHQPHAVAADVGFLALSAGTTHTCAIAEGGKLFCWGNDVDGRLGADAPGEASMRPRPVRTGLAFTDVAAGDAHTCALSRDGHLYCWGDGSDGQMVPGHISTARLPWRVDCK